jgi:hypothetical protein
MPRLPKIWLYLTLLAALIGLLPVFAVAQDDPNDAPLGDVARTLRKQNPPSQDVIDNDNLSQVMDQVDSKNVPGSALKFLMSGENQSFHVSAPDVTCSLSFTANTKALLSNQYAQMDLPPGDTLKLTGPATIEGDAITVSLFNKTDWHVSEVAVALTVVKKNVPADPSSPSASVEGVSPPGGLAQESEIRPEKKADVTVIYRMRSAAPPWTNTVFSAPLNLDLKPGDEWHWAIVQAKGYPPESYSGSMPQTTAQTTGSTILQPTVPPPLSLPSNPAPVTPNPR